jgi:spermidine/putrescine-binding protein
MKAKLVSGSNVKLYCWQGYDDKTALATLKSNSNVSVSPTYIGGDQEVFTKLVSQKSTGQWDVLTYNSGLDRGLFDAGALEALDPSAFSNAADIYPEFVDLAFIKTGQGNTVTGFPFSWGYQGFVRNSQLPALASWNDLFTNPALKGRIVSVNDPTTAVATMCLAAGFTEYDKLTADQLDHVMGMWRQLRPSLRTIVSDYGVAKDLLVRGEVDGCIPGWQAMVVWASQAGKTLYHDFPKEGVYGFLDLLCVLKGTSNLQNSMGFVDYMLSPQAQADLGIGLSQGITNQKGVPLLPQNLQQIYQYSDLQVNFAHSPIRKLPPFRGQNGFVGFSDWATAWEHFMAGA